MKNKYSSKSNLKKKLNNTIEFTPGKNISTGRIHEITGRYRVRLAILIAAATNSLII